MAIRSTQMVPSTSSRVLVKVDDYAPDHMSGRLYNPYLEKGGSFTDVMDLANKLDQMFDALSFPQAAMSYRSFDVGQNRGKKKAAEAQKEKASELAMENVPPLSSKEDDVFLVHVQFRQNADWQGTVSWVGSKEDLHFRSTLELFKIIDSAMASRSATGGE